MGTHKKKELDLHEKGLGVENWLRETKTTEKPMVIFVMTRYSQANHGSLAFSFYFPPVLLGKKKPGKKTTAPNKQPQNNQDFTFF